MTGQAGTYSVLSCFVCLLESNIEDIIIGFESIQRAMRRDQPKTPEPMRSTLPTPTNHAFPTRSTITPYIMAPSRKIAPTFLGTNYFELVKDHFCSVVKLMLAVDVKHEICALLQNCWNWQRYAPTAGPRSGEGTMIRLLRPPAPKQTS